MITAVSKSVDCPIIIGGAPSLCDYGEYFFKHISNKSPIILSGSNALFNFLNLEITIQNPLIMILSGSEIKKINFTENTNILKNSLQCCVDAIDCP